MDLETLGYYLFMQQQEEEQKQHEQINVDLKDDLVGEEATQDGI